MQSLDLTVARGPGKGKTVRLPADRPFSIGRGHSNDLTLSDRLVSSHHARIRFENGWFILTDLNSKNHTYVNGTQVSGSVILRDHDQIGIGNCVLLARSATSPAVQISDKPDTRPIKASIETSKTMAIDTAKIKTAIITMGRAEKNLAVLHAAGRLLADSQDPALFMPRILDLMFEVVPADRGAVFIMQGGEMRPLHARDAEGQNIENLAISRSVLRKAVDDGVSVLTGMDSGMNAEESIVLHQINSAICAPIRGRDEVLGAVYLDSKITGQAFDDDDLELLTTVAAHTGMAYENAHLAAESARSERMAAIGLLVAGLAHDMKNYMTGVTLGAEVLSPEVERALSPSGQDSWTAMLESVQRISDLVSDMLAYSKPREPDWKLIDPNTVAVTAVKALERRAVEAGVILEVKRHPKVRPFWHDGKAIERCLVNLASNGIDATPGGGTVTVRVLPGEDEAFVRYEVADTGAGIPPDARGQVFDLFFSTKASKGTGLGLAVTKKVVEEHGGSIEFTTEVNEGTTFTITLPKRDEKPSHASAN